MKYISLSIFTFILSISCSKKKDCLSQESEENWLIIEDSAANNLIETTFLTDPNVVITEPQPVAGTIIMFQRLEVTTSSGIEFSWKIDINRLDSNRKYEIQTDSSVFKLELEWEPKDPACDYKKYNARKLNCLKFEDTIFYGSGVHTFIDA